LRSAQADRRIDAVVDRVVVEPASRDGFGLRIKLHDLFAIRAKVAELRAARAGKAEERHRYRNRNVDADLADVDLALEFAGRRAALREEANTVAERIAIDERDRVVERGDVQYLQHGAENFGAIDFHFGADVGEDRRADEVALLVTGHRHVAAVERERGTFLHTGFDQAENALLR